MKHNSFTLIEILLVLALTLIICSLGIPYFINREHHALLNELEKLSVIFSYLQQRALATNQNQKLTFDIKNHTYSYNNGSKQATYKLSPSVHFGFLSQSKGPPSDPNTPITSPITFSFDENGTCEAMFFSNGKIKPGAIYLIDKYKKIMGALTCSVSQVSYIRRYLYKKSPHNIGMHEGTWVPLLSE